MLESGLDQLQLLPQKGVEILFIDPHWATHDNEALGITQLRRDFVAFKGANIFHRNALSLECIGDGPKRLTKNVL